MADKRSAPEAPEGAHRRKRVAPTIDLTATEIPPSPAENAASGPTDAPRPADPRVPEPVQEPPSDSPPAPAPEQEPPPPIDEPPPPSDDPAQLGSATSPPEPPAFEQPVTPPPRGGPNWAGMLAAGVAGGIVVAVVVGGLWYGGVLPSQAPQPATDASGQIATLQKQIEALQNRPAPAATPAVDAKAIDALNARVAKMETSLANLPKGDASMAERLAAAENAMKSLGVGLTALNTRSDNLAANAAQARTQAEAAEKAVTELRGSVQSAAREASTAVAPEQFEALRQRIGTLEQSVKAAREDIARTATAEKAARLALTAASLRNAVVGGVPYDAELKQAKSLGADDKTIAPLTPFASSGVPSAAALAQELRGLLPAMLKASGAQAPQGGFLERLQANASRLVRVTPVDAPPGDDPSAVLARLEVEAAHNDVAAALADLAKLPEAARAPAQAWIKKAQARQAALAAARDFAANSARSLIRP